MYGSAYGLALRDRYMLCTRKYTFWAGVLASFSHRMSTSLNTGASPAIYSRAPPFANFLLWLSLMITVSPTMNFSPFFKSTTKGMGAVPVKWFPEVCHYYRDSILTKVEKLSRESTVRKARGFYNLATAALLLSRSISWPALGWQPQN